MTALSPHYDTVFIPLYSPPGKGKLNEPCTAWWKERNAFLPEGREGPLASWKDVSRKGSLAGGCHVWVDPRQSHPSLQPGERL